MVVSEKKSYCSAVHIKKNDKNNTIFNNALKIHLFKDKPDQHN